MTDGLAIGELGGFLLFFFVIWPYVRYRLARKIRERARFSFTARMATAYFDREQREERRSKGFPAIPSHDEFMAKMEEYGRMWDSVGAKKRKP